LPILRLRLFDGSLHATAAARLHASTTVLSAANRSQTKAIHEITRSFTK
jgi:hypothetical protein